MAPFRSAKGFLQYGGIVLVALGVLGFFLIGPTPETSIFGSAWNFTMIENWVHLVLGIVALLAAFALKDEGQARMLVNLVGALALVVGVVGFFNTLGGVLQNPLDSILHVIVAIWAFWAAKKSGGSIMSSAPTAPTA